MTHIHHQAETSQVGPSDLLTHSFSDKGAGDDRFSSHLLHTRISVKLNELVWVVMMMTH